MGTIVQFLSAHAEHAHWFIFAGLLLAGCNIPISIDMLVILSAILAAQFVPEHTYILYFTLLIGCCLSAWIAYSLGRFLGNTLSSFRLFKPLLHPKKIEKMKRFYDKHGTWTFIVGRFIPFGVRNCIFMTSGLSKMPFFTFAWREAIACFIWVSLYFTLFFFLGHNFDKIWQTLRTFNLIIFIAFSVTVIGIIWYKMRKRVRIVSKNNGTDVE